MYSQRKIKDHIVNKAECPECGSSRWRVKGKTVTCSDCDHVISQPTKSKYGNARTEYKGFKYDSRLEADYAVVLDLRQQSGEIADWDRQWKIELRANGKLICNYYVDFRVHLKDGSYELVETKGYETDIWRFKRRLLEALWLPEHLDYTYTVVK